MHLIRKIAFCCEVEGCFGASNTLLSRLDRNSPFSLGTSSNFSLVKGIDSLISTLFHHPRAATDDEQDTHSDEALAGSI